MGKDKFETVNKTDGNHFEQWFCAKLFNYGFWVHNLTQNLMGQPADVIAVRNGKAYLIDCKLCHGKYFSVSRIEGNQHSSMLLWKKHGNGNGLFAIKIEDMVYMVSLEQILNAERKNLDVTWLKENALRLHEWEARA